MSSTHTPSGQFPDTAAKETGIGASAVTAKDESSFEHGPDAGVSAADGPEKEQGFTADEQRLLNEVKELITPFGPIEEAVKIKLPNSSVYIVIHGRLLIGKSSFFRAALTKKIKKGEAKERELKMPHHSVTTLAYFLKWIYNDTVLPTHVELCAMHAERRVPWADLVNLWIFASNIRAPKLQNHAVDILVRKMQGFRPLDERTDDEIDRIRAAFNLLWRGKHQAQGQMVQGAVDKPLRTLMMDWYANPMYQTKDDADQLWSGGLSRSFYRDFARYTIEKNFVQGDLDQYDEDDDLEEAAQRVLRCLWVIKPERYYVDDKAFANPVKNN